MLLDVISKVNSKNEELKLLSERMNKRDNER